MPYMDFTFPAVLDRFSLQAKQTALFPTALAVTPSAWLLETLSQAEPFALGSEKARSEFVVAPILLAVRGLSGNRVTLYSGQRFDVDASAGLSGECDFLLAAADPLPVVRAPIIGLVEAKKNDVEGGLGQCAAQMLGALRFNASENSGVETVYGCVTTGETWQFLRLNGNNLAVDTRRYYINELPVILGVFQSILSESLDALKEDVNFPSGSEYSDWQAVEFVKVLTQETRRFFTDISISIPSLDHLEDALGKWPAPDHIDVKIDVASGFGDSAQMVEFHYTHEEISIETYSHTYDERIGGDTHFIGSYYAQAGMRASDEVGEIPGTDGARLLIATAKQISIEVDGEAICEWERQGEDNDEERADSGT